MIVCEWITALHFPVGEDVIRSYRKRMEVIMHKLFERRKMGYFVDSFEIREIIEEYGFAQKQPAGLTTGKICPIDTWAISEVIAST